MSDLLDQVLDDLAGRVSRRVVEHLGEKPIVAGADKSALVPIENLDARLRALVLLKRAYERDLPPEIDTIESPTIRALVQNEHRRGIVTGMQMAIDKLANELDITIDDPPPPKRKPRVPSIVSPVASVGAGDDLSQYQTALLQVLAQRHPLACSDRQLSILSGYSSRSSEWGKAMAGLVSSRLVTGQKSGRSLTNDGIQRVGAKKSRHLTGDALLEMWRGKLEHAEGNVLAAAVKLARAAPGPTMLPPRLIAEEARYSVTSSSFTGAVSSLKKGGLIERDTNRPAPELLK